MQFRNYLYNIGHKPAFEFEQLVISVGNLSVGGTGKTPFIEYLVNYFSAQQETIKVTTLSRGYGRKTKGFILADSNSNASQIGDEPYQIYRKFHEHIAVSVCEDRVLAVPSILLERPNNQVILLDDAFQHRSIKPNFSIMLSDYNRPFYKDYVLPAGRLREGRNGAKRADVVIITKCPFELIPPEMDLIIKEVKQYAPDAKVYFTGITYAPISSKLKRAIKQNILLLTGIANTDSLELEVKKHFHVCKHLKFSDHHHFTQKEMQEAAELAKSLNADILTTEKDWVRIISHPNLLKEVADQLFYQPMMVQFLTHENAFISQLNQLVSDHINYDNTKEENSIN